MSSPPGSGLKLVEAYFTIAAASESVMSGSEAAAYDPHPFHREIPVVDGERLLQYALHVMADGALSAHQLLAVASGQILGICRILATCTSGTRPGHAGVSLRSTRAG